MTKFTGIFIAAVIVLAGFNVARAHDEGIEGLIIGGIGGAAIGHVISGTPEGVIVGSFIGSSIGLLASGDNHYHHVRSVGKRYGHPRWPGYGPERRCFNGPDRYRHGRRDYSGRWQRQGRRHFR